MMPMHLRRLATVLTGALILGVSGMGNEASAAITFTSTVGGLPTAPVTQTFNTLALGSSLQGLPGLTVGFTGTGAVVSGSASNAAPPVLSGGQGVPFGNQPNGVDTTNYLTSGVGSVILNFNVDQTNFGLLWGSVDSTNRLEFFDAANNSLGFVTGTDVLPPGSGNQGAAGTTYVNLTSTIAFRRVVASSTTNAFEFDNISFNAVPEPSSIILGLGFAAAGLVVAGKKFRKASANA